MREKNQTRIKCRYRSFLHHDQEQAHHAGKDRNEEIRSQGTQACHVQGNQAEVIRFSFVVQRKTRESGFFVLFGYVGWVECSDTHLFRHSIRWVLATLNPTYAGYNPANTRHISLPYF